MADVLESMDEALRGWIEAQPVFFVASAPTGADGFVNCSPKGNDSLRAIDGRTLVYLDFVGSGTETIAHVKQNGRIVVMLCAFDGPPRIIRVHGRGEVIAPGAVDFEELLGLFPPQPGVRCLIRVHAERISSSCGYGVPLMDFKERRKALPMWAEKRGSDGVIEYQRVNNARSLDGLRGVDWL